MLVLRYLLFPFRIVRILNVKWMKNYMNIIINLYANIAKLFFLWYINSNSSFLSFIILSKIKIMRDIDDVPLIMINECGQRTWSMFYYLEEDTFRVICACLMEIGVLGCVRTELIGIANNPFLSLLIHPISLNICHGLKAHASIKKMNFHKRVAV